MPFIEGMSVILKYAFLGLILLKKNKIKIIFDFDYLAKYIIY